MYNEELVRFGCKKILKLIEISFYSSAKIWKCGKMESYSGFCICLLSFWKYKNKYTCVFPKLNSQQLYVSQYVKVSDYVPIPSVDNFPSIEVSTDYNSSIVRGGLIWEDLGGPPDFDRVIPRSQITLQPTRWPRPKLLSKYI